MILILSIAMGADYSFEVKNFEIWARPFFKHNNSFVATVFDILYIQFLPDWCEHKSRVQFIFSAQMAHKPV